MYVLESCNRGYFRRSFKGVLLGYLGSKISNFYWHGEPAITPPPVNYSPTGADLELVKESSWGPF